MLQQERADYIIVVLLEDVPQKALTAEMKVYLKTYTYIDAREYSNDVEMIRKRIRFALPKVPLKQLKVIIHSSTICFHFSSSEITRDNILHQSKPVEYKINFFI